jgi:hypothetical protein
MALVAMVALALVSAGPVSAEENSCTDKSGTGWALLAGTGTLEFDGRATIVVLGENPKIETNGNGLVRRITPQLSVYRGSGKITIEGRKIAVYIRGSGHLEACGRGFANWGGKGLV